MLGVNEDKYDAQTFHLQHRAPRMAWRCLKVLLDELGIVKGTMTTILVYQRPTLAASREDLRRARAALNIIHHRRGKAIYLVIPE